MLKRPARKSPVAGDDGCGWDVVITLRESWSSNLRDLGAVGSSLDCFIVSLGCTSQSSKVLDAHVRLDQVGFKMGKALSHRLNTHNGVPLLE